MSSDSQSTRPNDSSGMAIVLAAHGSSAHEYCNQPLFETAKLLKESTGLNEVTPAFLDGEPNVRTVLQDLDADNVLVIPFMASDGYYSNFVFPREMEAGNKQVKFANAIGSHPNVVQVVAERLNSTIKEHCSNGSDVQEVSREDLTLLFVGHGTRKNKNSCRSMINLVKELRPQFSTVDILFAFIDQNPAVDLIASRLTSRQVIVVPFMMGMGPHVTEDVPTALGLTPISSWSSASERKPLVKSASSDGERQVEFIYDLPFGIWPELQQICHSIYSRATGQADAGTEGSKSSTMEI